jgi:hypothetical protein
MFDDGPGVYLATSALALAFLSYCRKYWLNRSLPPLPPGPTPFPMVGNVFNLDAARPWLTFNAWRSTYGWRILTEIFLSLIHVFSRRYHICPSAQQACHRDKF